MRVLWVALLLGCSASGSSSEIAGDGGGSSDSVVVDSSGGDVESDAIFPTEDATTGDDTSVSMTDSDTVMEGGPVDACDCKDITVNVNDCGTASCPPDYPFPVGCDITMGGSDSRGCVVHATGSSSVTFQVGSACSGTADGFITGTITCSKTAGAPLSAINCKITKPIKRYVTSLSACP